MTLRQVQGRSGGKHGNAGDQHRDGQQHSPEHGQAVSRRPSPGLADPMWMNIPPDCASAPTRSSVPYGPLAGAAQIGACDEIQHDKREHQQDPGMGAPGAEVGDLELVLRPAMSNRSNENPPNMTAGSAIKAMAA
jgi:hypothetical protein